MALEFQTLADNQISYKQSRSGEFVMCCSQTKIKVDKTINILLNNESIDL